jgi:hypothetical protein
VKAASSLLSTIPEIQNSKTELFSSQSFLYLCDYYGWAQKLILLKIEFFLDNDDGFIQNFDYFKNPSQYKKGADYKEFINKMEKFYDIPFDDMKNQKPRKTMNNYQSRRNSFDEKNMIEEKENNSVTSYYAKPRVDDNDISFLMPFFTENQLGEIRKKPNKIRKLKNGDSILLPCKAFDDENTTVPKFLQQRCYEGLVGTINPINSCLTSKWQTDDAVLQKYLDDNFEFIKEDELKIMNTDNNTMVGDTNNDCPGNTNDDDDDDDDDDDYDDGERWRTPQGQDIRHLTLSQLNDPNINLLGKLTSKPRKYL